MPVDEKTRFRELTTMKYADQAKWFLNGFWREGIENDSESVWKYTHKFMDLDEKSKKDGNELDEFLSHKFLESYGETLTVIQLREKLRKIDLDCNGKMALLEYLAFKFNKTVPAIINSPQGDNQDEVNEAARKLQAVQDAMDEVSKQLEQQTQALAQQKEAEEKATASLAAQKQAEETVKKAERELKAAVDDLKAQEDSFSNQIKKLEEKTKDTAASQVTRAKAAAELAQLKQEDPLPLRKAKISQEAALRKVEKERKAAEAATASAEANARDAEAKRIALEEQKKRVEEAYADCETRVQEAQNFLEEVKKKGGVAHGAIWWMERELKEAQKYMPKKKQTQ